MKNVNYNLVKMLLAKLDDVWRVEKHYAKDAEAMNCADCQRVLNTVLDADKKHAEMLREELSRHIKGQIFE